MNDPRALVSLGKIVKTQGLQGSFRVYPHAGESENLPLLDRVLIRPARDPEFEADVRECRAKGSLYILSVKGVDTIDRAEALVGAEVLAYLDDLEPVDEEEGEFYWYEVVGLEVVTDEGEVLGTVRSIIPTGANDVLHVSDGKSEVLLPNIPDVILDIDRDARRITVHLLPGLR